MGTLTTYVVTYRHWTPRRASCTLTAYGTPPGRQSRCTAKPRMR